MITERWIRPFIGGSVGFMDVNNHLNREGKSGGLEDFLVSGGGQAPSDKLR